MKFKKILAVGLALVGLIVCGQMVWGQENSLNQTGQKHLYTKAEMEESLTIYQAQNPKYQNIEDFSFPIWEKYGLLVKKGTEYRSKLKYKDPYKADSQEEERENKHRQGEWRYLGTTIEGYLAENPDYPADAYKGKPFSQFHWLENHNKDTSLWKKLGEIPIKEEKEQWYNYYLELIKNSFSKEYAGGFDWENFTPEIELAMMKAAILVYPMAEGKRTLISFRNQGADGKIYEVTVSGPNHEQKKKEREVKQEWIPQIPESAASPQGQLRILSAGRGREIYDVSQGIPATEMLYIDAQAPQYLAYYEYSTAVYIEIIKTYDYDSVTHQYVVVSQEEIPHYYQVITKAYVYQIASVDVYNHALPEGKAVLLPQDAGVTTALTQGGYREEDGEVTTWDATLTINGHTITAGESLAEAPLTEPGVLYQENIRIPAATLNAKDTLSFGQVNYELVLSHGEDFPSVKTQGLSGNPVTTHTPVVCYPELVERRQPANEKYKIKKKKNPLYVKEESLIIHYPVSGEHLPLPGYGKRDYANYMAKRQVRFSFDVYLGKGYDGIYLPAGQWHDFPVALSQQEKEEAEKKRLEELKKETKTNPKSSKSKATKANPSKTAEVEMALIKTAEELAEIAEKNQAEWAKLSAKEKKARETAEYFIPAWVTESENHKIDFRSLPINLADESSQEYEIEANKEISKYKAVKSLEICIFGKITEAKLVNVADGRKRNNLELPVSPQSGILANRLDGVYLGMPVDFQISTNGDLFYSADSIKVKPRYYFVDKQGKKTEVDLYYHGNTTLRKINAKNEEIMQKAKLSEFNSWYESKWLEDTAKILEGQKRGNGMTYSDYADMLNSAKYTKLGDNSELVIGERLKLYTGRKLAERIVIPKGVSLKDVLKSHQNWYFRFFLPNESYVVPKNTDFKKLDSIRLHQEPFLHDGYILVELELQVYKNGELLLSYQTESKSPSSIPYQPSYGDTIFYDSERRASQMLN